MNRWTLLLIVIALGAAGMLNKDKISAMLAHKDTEEASAEAAPRATPNPATDSRLKAAKMYPALAVQGSPLNSKFLELYKSMQEIDPAFLTKEDWPMRLAEKAAREVNTAAVTPMPRPTDFSNSALNNRPANFAGSTVPPSVQLPGLQGSALDQRPPKHH